MLRKTLACVCGLLAVAMPSMAQTPATTSATLAWTQANVPDAATAQAYTYRYYPDGAAVGIVLSGVSCSGAAPVTCQAPFPAFTPGSHTLQLSAANSAGESAKSGSLAFVFVVVPSPPTELRIQ